MDVKPRGQGTAEIKGTSLKWEVLFQCGIFARDAEHFGNEIWQSGYTRCYIEITCADKEVLHTDAWFK